MTNGAKDGFLHIAALKIIYESRPDNKEHFSITVQTSAFSWGPTPRSPLLLLALWALPGSWSSSSAGSPVPSLLSHSALLCPLLVPPLFPPLSSSSVLDLFSLLFVGSLLVGYFYLWFQFSLLGTPLSPVSALTFSLGFRTAFSWQLQRGTHWHLRVTTPPKGLPLKKSPYTTILSCVQCPLQVSSTPFHSL